MDGWWRPATVAWLRLLRYDVHGDPADLDAAAASGSPQVAGAALRRLVTRDGRPDRLGAAVAQTRATADETVHGVVPLWLTRPMRWAEAASALTTRFQLRGGESDLDEALSLLRRAVRAADARPPARAWCLGRLASAEQDRYTLRGDPADLRRSIRHCQQALAGIRAGHRRALLQMELGVALQDRFALTGQDEDLGEALRLARAGLAAAAPGSPDRPAHLANLGTAYESRFEQTGDERDLRRAERAWAQALDALPPASPYRPYFLDRVALGLHERFERTGRTAHLRRAVRLHREAMSSGAGLNGSGAFAANLAAATVALAEHTGDPRLVDSAVEALDAVTGNLVRDAPVWVDFAETLLSRYRHAGDPADLDRADQLLSRVGAALPATSAGTLLGAHLTLAHARVLILRYERAGVRADLARAVRLARRAVRLMPAGAALRQPALVRLSLALFLRFDAYGRRADLDEAIALARQVAPAEHAHSRASHLAGLLAVRAELFGEPDGDAAAAPALPDRPDSNLAAALHGRFQDRGRWQDLDAAVTMQRGILAGLAPAAPARRVVLSNLALALQDRYVYRDAPGDLAEAIRMHEEAVRRCPPDSPERPGYLHTLAGALQSRGDARSLGRAVDCAREALAAGASGPYRGRYLRSLAEVLVLRDTGDDLDTAVGLLRKALRAVGPAARDRAETLAGLGGALALRFDQSGTPADRAAAHRAYAKAVEASRSPVTVLDVAGEWGDWARRHRAWRQARRAYTAATRASGRLDSVNLQRDDRLAWLARGERLHLDAASVELRCGDPRAAVMALETGRARLSAGAIGERTARESLRREGRGDLADRYEATARRLLAAERRPGGG